MKKNKSSKVDKLLIDVVEYAFIEWLVRRKLYTAFQSNYDRTPTAAKTFRDHLREHIRYLFGHPVLGPQSLVSSAFLFSSTPEGCRFWNSHSEAWRRFYTSLQK